MPIQSDKDKIEEVTSSATATSNPEEVVEPNPPKTTGPVFDQKTGILTLTSPEDVQFCVKNSSVFNSAKKIVLGEAITRIPDYIFKNWKNLESVTGNNIDFIGYNSFHRCSRLTVINFPKATRIDSNAFSYCENYVMLAYQRQKKLDSKLLNRVLN